ncbi:MAG: acyl-CoA dehydratase activase [Lachnospiraceae bacterium]|nr:acyl-CoA dehydratase activase [Lachnospiraceae bacterium]
MTTTRLDALRLTVGIDIGSTTTKILAVNDADGSIVLSDYRRHHADQAGSVCRALILLSKACPDEPDTPVLIRAALTGSGSGGIAEALGVPFVQEVVANSIALRDRYENVSTAIELGGQDAKMIFFRRDENTGVLNVADMRMNGSCAGGTGAFIDEVASILKVPIEEFNGLAEKGDTVYDISGRCGVYAKTDIQPLLNQGVSRANLALSSFHAIAKQTIGGLAQGLDIHAPVVFEGGPLTFNPRLVRVFAERLLLSPEDVLIPENPEMMIAKGAVLAVDTMFADTKPVTVRDLLERLSAFVSRSGDSSGSAKPFFDSSEEQAAFLAHHRLPEFRPLKPRAGQVYRAFLGIDSGSTTTKFVLMDEDEQLLDSFYAPNAGDPLTVAKNALIAMRNRFRDAGAGLEILAAGATGYGEMLFHRAFSTECHAVETVAHARATRKYVGDATFILDIGGQDMKAIWLSDGIITNIVVNEACSSGCGSFLENFAGTLHIPVEEIAASAFRSEHPAALGSRCTVFMNSSIITEQRNGRKPDDIMAGLCRSIIENVFTKVIRLSNLDALGDHVVVQGGTFQNDAVLRAMEQYLGREVVRAPYPGIMGAIGAALLTKDQYLMRSESGRNPAAAAIKSGSLAQNAADETVRRGAAGQKTSDAANPHTFIGLDALDSFSYTEEANSPCPFCGNHCRRSVLTFPNGNSWVTNNRCERGEILGDPKDKSVQMRLKQKAAEKQRTANLFDLREKLLFQDYDAPALAPKQNLTIGLPRVLSFWDTMPYWTTFFRSLGYDVRISDQSSRKLYESGLSAVTSDTVCFPAKLVHGHIRNLTGKADRIFMPAIATVPSENREKTSEFMCAVVKGYPIVIRNSDNPEGRCGVPFDAPLFHWHENADRTGQLVRYMKDTFGTDEALTAQACAAADAALDTFHRRLKEAGAAVLEEVRKNGSYAVVLASRPYQNDPLVNHQLPQMFTELGIPVLTADSLPGAEQVDLRNSRLDISNNYHARMLSSAVLAAQNPNLEYVQIVSFGCGHDAYLSDEIIRMMKEISDKTPLVLKVDESDIQGPLRIRVRSFTETVAERRRVRRPAATPAQQHPTEDLPAEDLPAEDMPAGSLSAEESKTDASDTQGANHKVRADLSSDGNTREATATAPEIRPLSDPFPVKFTKADRKTRVVLIPNVSHAFCRVLSAVFNKEGLVAEPLEVGREEAIRLGKQYVHNDICFPSQIVIGEALAALRSGKYDPDHVAIGMAKYISDCRLTHYSSLLRKALDDAGYPQVPIVTNDGEDSHNLHPGYRMGLMSQLRTAVALPMIDVLEELLRKIRPYEKVPGSADEAFERGMDAMIDGLTGHGIRGMRKGFKKALSLLSEVQCDRTNLRPTVLIVGEYLLNFHPGANHDIERYLERNGFEIIEARMSDVIRKTFYARDRQITEYHMHYPLKDRFLFRASSSFFDLAHDITDRLARRSPLYKKATRLPEIAAESDPIIPHTFDAGEGVIIPGEIIHHAKHGCRNFVILQPFGCLPNHVVGRGVVKKLKELYPDAQILPLDYDPDVSFANIENRLQMLVMNAKKGEAV